MLDVSVARQWAEDNQVLFDSTEELIRLYEAALPDWQGLQAAFTADLTNPLSLFRGLIATQEGELVQLAIRQKSLDLLQQSFADIQTSLTAEQMQQVLSLLSAHNFTLGGT